MKLENQVTSLGLSKKLKELGVKQESIFMWDEIENKIYPSEPNFPEKYWREMNIVKDNYISAFTVAELGEMLPSCVKNFYWLYITNWHDYELTYKTDDHSVVAQERNDSETNARAKMLIYLLENNLMEIPK